MHRSSSTNRAFFVRARLALLAIASVLISAPGCGGNQGEHVAAAAPGPAANGTKLATHMEMARRLYEPQTTPRWSLPRPGYYTADGEARPEWRVTTWGPVNRESSHMAKGGPVTDHTDEFRMYWSRIPDFRITEYQVWPTETGWIARILYGGTTADGTPVLAHQADFVTVDESGKVVRIEWYCDAGEWIEQVWTRASGLNEQQVRTTLAKPDGFRRLIDIALGRAKYEP